MSKFLPWLMLMLLANCSNYKNDFECKIGQGVNCISVSKINNMVDSGTFNQLSNPLANNKIKKQTIKIANKVPFPLVLPKDLHNSMVQRTADLTLRIWVAPYVSDKDGYIEAQYVHEVLEKSTWVEQME